MKTLKAREGFDEAVTEKVFAEAVERGRQRRSPDLHATGVNYLSAYQMVLVGFADDSAVAFAVKNYPELAALNPDELERLKIGFGGSALCLEEKDLHVSIAGLVSASQALMEMAATVVAVRNGRRSSEAKVRAARENGHKGGRPRKLAAA